MRSSSTVRILGFDPKDDSSILSSVSVFGGVALMGEQGSEVLRVDGSNPSSTTNFK